MRALTAHPASIAPARVCPEQTPQLAQHPQLAQFSKLGATPPVTLVLPPALSAAEKITTPSILSIDPGTLESGWVILRGRRVVDSGVSKNQDLLPVIAAWDEALAIEMIASYGMPVGREVFETCVWIGRFVQAYRYSALAQLVYRKDVKTHLCGTLKAKDPHIRQALIDLIGPQGVKKAPGPTYGVKSHAWAALGVAATAMKLQREAIAPELPL